jgi:hypothetical protein
VAEAAVSGEVPAATLAAEQVAAVRDAPDRRLALLQAAYASPPDGAIDPRYGRAAQAFQAWQVRRGLLNPPSHPRPGSAWWRAANERLLLDTLEVRLRVLGHPGPSSSPAVDAGLEFVAEPTPSTWYRAHNLTIVRAFLDHRHLAEQENRVERFFLNLVLARVLYAHALVASPRLALGRLRAMAPRLGDPRRDLTGIFLSVRRVLPDVYPAEGELDEYLDAEHTLGRLLDVGVIVPRLEPLYAWSAEELGVPALAGLVQGPTPTYAWDPEDRAPWAPQPTLLVRAVRRALPPPGGGAGRR